MLKQLSLLFCTLLFFPACHALARPASVNRPSSPDPLAVLYSNMPSNSWKELTGPKQGSYGLPDSGILARTCKNFDGRNAERCERGLSGGTFSSRAAVQNAYPYAQNWDFSGGAVDPVHRLVATWGGGHGNTGDGSIPVFDIDEAADRINARGVPDGSWKLKIPSGRAWPLTTKDVRQNPCGATNPRPTVFPAASHQTGGNYWVCTNVDGHLMPAASHSYSTPKILPKTSVMIVGGTCDWDAACANYMGDAYGFDLVSGAIYGPMYSAGVSGSAGTRQGFAEADNGVVGIDDADGLAYTLAGSNGRGWTLYRWNNPLDPTQFSESVVIGLINDAGTDRATAPAVTSGYFRSVGIGGIFTGDLVFIPDTVDRAPAQRCALEYYGVNHSEGQFGLICGLNGSVPTAYWVRSNRANFAASLEGTNESGIFGYNPADGTLYMTQGAGTLYKIDYRDPSPLKWTFAQIGLSATGDVPVRCAPGQGVPALGVIKLAGVANGPVVYYECGHVYVYKP